MCQVWFTLLWIAARGACQCQCHDNVTKEEDMGCSFTVSEEEGIPKSENGQASSFNNDSGSVWNRTKDNFDVYIQALKLVFYLSPSLCDNMNK